MYFNYLIRNVVDYNECFVDFSVGFAYVYAGNQFIKGKFFVYPDDFREYLLSRNKKVPQYCGTFYILTFKS